MHPVTIVLVDALATDFNLNVVDQVVTNPVQPTELSTRAIGYLQSNLRQSGLEVHAMNQITVTLNGAGDFLAEVGGTIEGVLNGLHGEVSVTSVHDFKKCNLGVTCEVNILRPVGNQLHKPATGHELYLV